jgi:hypothetical protein
VVKRLFGQPLKRKDLYDELLEETIAFGEESKGSISLGLGAPILV